MLIVLLGSTLAAQAATARVIKVLPHFLDKEGHESLSPSLFERDAYQLMLQKKPALRRGLRFDIQWKGVRHHQYQLRVEARGGQADGKTTQLQLQSPLRPAGFFSQWGAVVLEGDSYRKFGELVSWRVTLWEGDKLVGEQNSFLW